MTEKEMVKYQAKSGRLVLETASKEVREDLECCLEAIKYNSSNWQFVSKRLKENEEFEMQALEINPEVANELGMVRLLYLVKKLVKDNKKLADDNRILEESREQQDREHLNESLEKIGYFDWDWQKDY